MKKCRDAKALRSRLFKKNRPNIRDLRIMEGADISKDIKILWVAHKNKPFPFLSHVTEQEEFLHHLIDASRKLPFYVAEDINPEYEGYGLIALIASKEDGWRIEPHVEFLPWASKRNILRTHVAFFQMVRYSRKIGVCVVKTLKKYTNVFDHCIGYFPPNIFMKVGKIPHGDIRGDEYLYSIRGRKE